MPARFGKILVVIALVFSTGLHWAALQTVAWTTMIAANLSTENFSTAVSQTFDGKHLCPLCKAIAAGKKSEKKSEAMATTVKMEFPPLTERFIVISPGAISAFSLADIIADLAFYQPSVPPPRGLFV